MKSKWRAWKRQLKTKIIIFTGHLLTKLLGMSLRFRVIGREQIADFQGKKGLIINTWHGQQLTGFYFFRDRGLYILSSFSRDGDYSSSIMRKFGWKIIRGSSSRGAVRGLIELMRVLRQGGGMAITPDGPRGPVYHIEPGGIYLSHKTGAPLIPVAFVFDRQWVSEKSWDKFIIPKPFARCVAYFGEPLFVEGELDDDRLEAEKIRLQAALHDANIRGKEVLEAWRNRK